MSLIASSGKVDKSFLFVNVTVTLTPSQTGTTFICDSTLGNQTANLPAPTVSGLNYTFYKANTGNVTNVTSTAANMTGFWAQVNGTKTLAGPSTTVRFTATGTPDDVIRIQSDGTNWRVQGETTVAAGIAFA